MLVRQPLELDAAEFIVRLIEVVGADGVLVAAEPLVDAGGMEVGPGNRVFKPVDHVGDCVAEVFWSANLEILT